MMTAQCAGDGGDDDMLQFFRFQFDCLQKDMELFFYVTECCIMVSCL